MLKTWGIPGRAVLSVGLLLTLALVVMASSSPQDFRLRDDCEPASFNAVIGPGTCIGNGDTSFADFIAQLTKDQVAGAWRISPDDTGLHPGQPTTIVNRGGETHTFTKVANFGGGFVPILNSLSGNPVPAPECVNFPAVLSTFHPAGSSAPGPVAGTADLPSGQTKFQCCIHPWMRTVVAVK